jgi:uncharacterized protein (DUF2141 family)
MRRGERAGARRFAPVAGSRLCYSRRVKAKLFVGAAVGLALALGMATAHAAPLTIVVDNVCSAQGEIDLTVFDAADWLSNSAGVDRKLPAQAGSVTFHFDLPPGTYAAAGFHDANGNGQFDKNFLGWPLEGFGFSNDAHVSIFKPPSFAAASFNLPPTGATETVRLDYWSKC